MRDYSIDLIDIEGDHDFSDDEIHEDRAQITEAMLEHTTVTLSPWTKTPGVNNYQAFDISYRDYPLHSGFGRYEENGKTVWHVDNTDYTSEHDAIMAALRSDAYTVLYREGWEHR